jgi:hypothetical protein
MATFLTDNFTDTNGVLISAHTADTGGTWTQRNPWSQSNGSPRTVTAQIATNTARATTSGGGTTSHAVYQHSSTPGTTDYRVSADFVWTAAPNDWIGLGARTGVASNASNNITGYWLLVNSSTVQIWKMASTDGSASAVTGGISIALATGITYRMTVEVIAQTVAARIQRLSDNQWLTAAGAWQAGQVNCQSAADGTFGGPGQVGFDIRGDTTTTGVGLDFIQAIDQPATPILPAPVPSKSGYFYIYENAGFFPPVGAKEGYFYSYLNLGFLVTSDKQGYFYGYEGDVNTLVPTPHIWFVTPGHGRPGDGVTVYGSGMGANQATYNGSVEMLFGVSSWTAQGVTGWRFPAAGTHAYDSQRTIDPNAGVINVEHNELDIVIPSNAVPPGHQVRFRTDA